MSTVEERVARLEARQEELMRQLDAYLPHALRREDLAIVTRDMERLSTQMERVIERLDKLEGDRVRCSDHERRLCAVEASDATQAEMLDSQRMDAVKAAAERGVYARLLEWTVKAAPYVVPPVASALGVGWMLR